MVFPARLQTTNTQGYTPQHTFQVRVQDFLPANFLVEKFNRIKFDSLNLTG